MFPKWKAFKHCQKWSVDWQIMAKDMLDGAQMVLHGEQVVNTSTIDKNSLGMRNRPSVELATSAR